MLKLILGGSGSGKTFTVMERIGELLAKDPTSAPILLVPEQFSYETERLLLKRLPPKEAGRVKVYSFTRFSELVLQESGAVLQKPLDEATRLLLLDEAFYNVQDKLSLFTYREGNIGRLNALAGAMKELKQNAVTHEMLQAAVEVLPGDSGLLKRKLVELDLLQESFSALIADRFDDPQDLMTQAWDALTKQPALHSGVSVFLDGFTGFTAQEERLISCLMGRAADVTAALCCDSYVDGAEEEYDLFMLPKRTARRLIRLAKEAGLAVEAPFTQLIADHRHKGESLTALCGGMYRSGEEKYEAETETERKAVTVFSCKDKDEECRAAAREIRFFLRNGIPDEEGESAPGRCRDVAVITRSPQEYSGALEMALQSEGIPCYVDARESIRSDALIETVCAALRTVRFSFRTEDILRLLKTGFTGMTTEQVATLENYVYQWSVQGKRWCEEFTDSPEGLRESEDEKKRERAAEELAALNALRQATVEPLMELESALSDKVDGEGFARAIITYLESIHADEQTRRRIGELEAKGQPALADRTERVWNVTMELLDTFAKGGAQPRSLAVWTELLDAAATATELGTVPQGLDAVQIGGVDRSRLSEPRVVVLLGVNEGVFPALPSFNSILTERERAVLELNCEMTLSKSAECVLTEELLYAYSAVSAAREKVIMTYARGGLRGETLLSSSLIGEVERLLPCCDNVMFRTNENWMPETPEEAFSYFTATYRNPTALTSAVFTELCKLPEQRARMEALLRHAEKTQWAFEEPAAAKELFRESTQLSASRVEKYYQCPFSYFCRYGLKIQPRERAKMDARERGSFIHEIMEALVPRYVRAYGDEKYASLTEAQIRADIEELTARYMAETLSGTRQKSAQMCYEIHGYQQAAFRVMCHLIEEFRQSRFVPTDFELTIGADGDIPPLSFTLTDGTVITFGGRVDRVDVFVQGEVTYLRVLDYKTGGKDFKLEKVMSGADSLQMLLYLYALCEEGSRRYANPRPAGVLYMPSKFEAVDVAKGDAETERAKGLKMKGFLLDEREVIEAMEFPLNGKYIPVKTKANGDYDVNSYVVTESQYGALESVVKRKVIAMAENLFAGRIEAFPAAESDACKHCDYKAVCGREIEDPERKTDYFPSGISRFQKKMQHLEQKENGSSATEEPSGI